MSSEGEIPRLVVRLEAHYGRAETRGRYDPLDELVSCILSQHTTDATSFPTFDRLKVALPTWDAIEMAGVEGVERLIRRAGLAKSKARSIVGSLRAIRDRFGEFTLEPLRSMSDQDAREFLVSLPGVGEKTAAIVLCFALDRDVVPVDTHVYRVSKRLGLIPERCDASGAHRVLDEAMPAGWAYRFHMAAIAHGRATCRARRPRCAECVIADVCPSRGMECS